MTGWTFGQIGAMTLPQLTLVTEGQGPILFPRLRPQLDAQFAKLSSKAGDKGEPSDIRQIINEHQAAMRGEKPPLTAEQEERQLAYRIRHAYYLGETLEQAPEAQPIEGLPPETARAIMAFASANLFPTDIWARDVAPLWRAIQASAKG